MKLNVFKYIKEVLDENHDDGTIVENVEKLESSVIGRRIVSAERQQIKSRGSYWRTGSTVFVITLDNGDQVQLFDTADCCAYTTLENFLLHPQSVDHVILGVGTTEKYTTWHIYADFGDILALEVDWSCGNPFYYGYGFDINVVSTSFS
jgi:hypothetical protein